jgi:pimeloyl-ACP methyl ester carboxylesterase
MEDSGNHSSSGKAGTVGEKTVVVLHGSTKSALVDQLRRDFRVVALEVPAAHDLAGAIKQHNIGNFSLIADSAAASAAIAFALESGDSMETLTLIAPHAISTNGGLKDLPLEEIRPPTLVLFGTRDEVAAQESGRLYARRIPKCFYALVYDAGRDIVADRPHALYAVVRDFLLYADKFVFPHEVSAINP